MAENSYRTYVLTLLLMVLLGMAILVWLAPEARRGYASNLVEAKRPWGTAAHASRVPVGGVNGGALGSGSVVDAPAREGERLLRFATDEAYRGFLAKAGRYGVKVLGSLDALRAIRVAVEDAALWRAVPAEAKGEESANYLVSVPTLPDGGIQAGALGFDDTMRAWLGITGDNTTWGDGVTVAVLDSGIAAHPGLAGKIESISLLGQPLDPAANGHGTGVASLVAGTNPLTPGIAPGAKLLSIQVVDASGYSDSFLVAQGILEAVGRGAQVVNISLGSAGDSRVLRDAVAYASANGVVIVAAAGNNGINQVLYPAAYGSVLSVGSIDANGVKLDFSNTGAALDLTAPGYNLNVAWPGEQIAAFTGTSASAPIVSGAIAATMSNLGISAEQAAELVLAYGNEAGGLGQDTSYGAGILDVGRVMAYKTPGIHDAAVAWQTLSLTPAGGVVDVIVQNRGTEPLPDAQLTVSAGGQQSTVNIGPLAAGESISQRVKVGEVGALTKPGAVLQSTVRLGGGLSDANARNNQRSATLAR